MGEERDTAAEVAYLLAELSSGGQGAVHEIGARARVLDADGDRLVLAIDCGDHEDVVTCRRGLVAQAHRSLASRRRVLRSAQPSAA
jgi:hypothetical protein